MQPHHQKSEVEYTCVVEFQTGSFSCWDNTLSETAFSGRGSPCDTVNSVVESGAAPVAGWARSILIVVLRVGNPCNVVVYVTFGVRGSPCGMVRSLLLVDLRARSTYDIASEICCLL